MHTPLRIDFKLSGLMAVPERYPPLLDAILLAQLAQGKQLPRLHADLLPLAVHHTDKSWFWMASALQVNYSGPSTARFLYRNARPLDMLGHAHQHSASRVYLDRGVTRTVKNRIKLRQADSATAWCIGDAGLLRDLLTQLTHLGSLRHLGHGLITRITLTEDPVAHERAWLRPTPSLQANDPYAMDRVATQGQCQPPYWDRSTSIAYWPLEAI